MPWAKGVLFFLLLFLCVLSCFIYFLFFLMLFFLFVLFLGCLCFESTFVVLVCMIDNLILTSVNLDFGFVNDL